MERKRPSGVATRLEIRQKVFCVFPQKDAPLPGPIRIREFGLNLGDAGWNRVCDG